MIAYGKHVEPTEGKDGARVDMDGPLGCWEIISDRLAPASAHNSRIGISSLIEARYLADSSPSGDSTMITTV